MDATGSLQLSGTCSPVIKLASGSESLRITGSTGTGSSVSMSPDTENFTGTVNFGNVSAGDGTPLVATAWIRVWSNCHYKVTMSRSDFQATNMSYNGNPITSTDGGSFLSISAAGPPQASGPLADASQSTVSLGDSLALSQLPSGPVTSNSRIILSGQRASLAGGFNNTSNSIQLPIAIACPTGAALAPTVGDSMGTFSATVQFGIYAN